MTSVNKGLCPGCIHLLSMEPPVCTAFPAGIPAKYISGEQNHTKPDPDDHGIQFESKAIFTTWR